MSEEKTKIKFYSQKCEDKFNLLNDELKSEIIEGDETYTPKCIVLSSSMIFYNKENLAHLISLDGFVALKRIQTFGNERTEIIFEK